MLSRCLYRSHFGSRYKSGPCFTAGLFHAWVHDAHVDKQTMVIPCVGDMSLHPEKPKHSSILMRLSCKPDTNSRSTNLFHFLLGGPISPAPWQQVELWPCVKWYTYAEGCLDCVSPCEQHSRLKSPSSCYSCIFLSCLTDFIFPAAIIYLLRCRVIFVRMSCI